MIKNNIQANTLGKTAVCGWKDTPPFFVPFKTMWGKDKKRAVQLKDSRFPHWSDWLKVI